MHKGHMKKKNIRTYENFYVISFLYVLNLYKYCFFNFKKGFGEYFSSIEKQRF